MRIFFASLFFATSLFSSNVEELIWASGETFTNFLENNALPLRLYYNAQKVDKELLGEIVSGTKFQVLRDDDDKILQALIPVTEELQIHIFKNTNNDYELIFSPISYQTENYILSFKIQSSPYQDIITHTNNNVLADAIVSAFGKSLDFRKLRNGDNMVIIYSQKRRLGRVFGTPEILCAMVEVRGKPNYIFSYDGGFYDEKGKSVNAIFLIKPLGNARISSHFTHKRFHPILRIYRAHLGVDYAARAGTPIKAAGNGMVKFVGTKGGYGKSVIITHEEGYETLYGHLSRYDKKAKKGSFIKQGQVIGYVGNTGISTGPHLHFGLYKNRKAINPEKVVKIEKQLSKKSDRKKFFEIVEKTSKVIKNSLAKNDKNPPREEDFDDFMMF